MFESKSKSKSESVFKTETKSESESESKAEFKAKTETQFQLQLTLLCSLALEEKLLDCLLMLPQVSVFTSTESAAHGVSLSQMNAMEQVMGRSQIVQVQVLLAERDKSFVIDKLKIDFAHTQIRYWLSPILEQGVLS